MPFIPHTLQEEQEMLQALGVTKIDDLFDEIPQSLRNVTLDKVPEGITELELTQLMQARAAQDQGLICFAGAGAYEHHIPAAVWDIASRGEFYTAYTPYQAEASQGTLQLLYEYQTMMTQLMGMEVSNASMYDGASALAEAVLMAIRGNRQSKSRTVLMPRTVHPAYRRAVRDIVSHADIKIIEIPFCLEKGITTIELLEKFAPEDFAALVIPQPNFFGQLEQVDALTTWAHEHDAWAIGLVNPIATALLKAPGQWGDTGVEVACGEGQSLGIPLASGGPYFGFFCCKKEHVRQMPGRLIGLTNDTDGKRGFTLTLQAREQHIRRGKATSNICTNQGLMVTAATIFMSLVGAEGLKRVAASSLANTQALVKSLTQLDAVETVFPLASFHEKVLRLPVAGAQVVEELAQQGILAGYALEKEYPELPNTLLVCATEVRTAEEIEKYKAALKNCTFISTTVDQLKVHA
jgi:glycine dehydrogenase subunit 1